MNKFIFRKEYLEKLDGLDSLSKSEAIEDIVNYGLYEREPQSEGGIIMINFFRDVLDDDKGKILVYGEE